MTKIVNRAIYGAALVIVLLCTSLLKAQQAAAPQAADPPSAPVPSQIFAGKRAFISNASGENINPPGSSDLNYSQFYASMKSWGRYELVAAPADADLVFEIRYEQPFGPVNVFRGEGGSRQYPQIRVSILDPKTHILLWAFTEPIVEVRKKATGMQNFQGAMDKLMGDIKTLATPAAAVSATCRKPQ